MFLRFHPLRRHTDVNAIILQATACMSLVHELFIVICMRERLSQYEFQEYIVMERKTTVNLSRQHEV